MIFSDLVLKYRWAIEIATLLGVVVVLVIVEEAPLGELLETTGVSTAKMHPSESKKFPNVGAGVVIGGGVRTLCESIHIITIRKYIRIFPFGYRGDLVVWG